MKAWIIVVLAALIAEACHMKFINDSYEQKFSAGLIVKPPELAKACALGYDRLLADFYWLVFLQYYGDRRSGSQDLYSHAPDYLKLIVTLDPQFTRAYWYVSFVIAGDLAGSRVTSPTPEAREIRLKQAKDILDEGIKNNPDSWDLPYIAAFNQYLYAKNPAEASRYYRLASKMKNAPAFLGRMAEIMAEGALDIKKDADSWTSVAIYGSSPAVRTNARIKAQYLWSKIYYSPRLPKNYKDAAENGLHSLGVSLLPENEIEPEQNQANSDPDNS